jgi:tight adherence protein B
VAEVALLLAAVLAGALVLAGRGWLARRAARRRLQAREPAGRGVPGRSRPVRLLRRQPWLPAFVALGVALLAVALGLPPVLGASLAAVAALVAGPVEDAVRQRRQARLEAQLADAIDVMIGAMRAGGSVVVALEAAVRASGEPLRAELETVVGRLRLGDDPHEVLRALAARLTPEPFRLFAFTLGVHWEAGGSLAPALGTTARAVRDRIELGRRVRAQIAEMQASVVAIVLVTYGLGYWVWRSDPARMAAFVGSTPGLVAMAVALLLQGVGLYWMWRLVRVRV